MSFYMKGLSKSALLNAVYTRSCYKGKHIIIIGGKIYAAKTGLTASKMLESLLKKHPKEIPTLTYIPKADTLVLYT